MSSRRLQDVLNKKNLFPQLIRLKYIFKRFSRHLQDIFKTSSRRLDQGEYVSLTHTSSEDVLIKSNIIVLLIRLQDVFKTSCQDVFRTSCKIVFKTSSRSLVKSSSRHLQDVLSSRRLQDIFKTSSRRFAKISSRRFQVASSS